MAKPRVVFINQHYYPDVAATAMVLTDVCRFLVTKGYEVHVISSQFDYDAPSSPMAAEECNEGVFIHRVWNTRNGRHSFKGRLIDYFTFFFQAFRTLMRLRTDVVITLTTPPLVSLLGWFHSIVKGSKLICWCMDLHPEAEIAAGLISKRGSLARVLSFLNEISFFQAKAVVALNPSMRDRLKLYKLPASKVKEIPIWSNETEIQPLSFQKSTPFTVMYSGNLGLAHTYEGFVQVMNHFKTDADIRFIFVGGGPKMHALKERVQELGITYCTFESYADRSTLAASLSRADVHWLSLRPEFEGIAFPSKNIGYLASGRPVIFLGNPKSDSASIIEKANAGKAFDENNLAAAINYLTFLKHHPEEKELLGKNARAFFETHFTRTHLSSSWEKIIASVLK